MERLLPEIAHRSDSVVGSVGAACRKGQRVSIVLQLNIAKIPLSDSSLTGEYVVRTCISLDPRKGGAVRLSFESVMFFTQVRVEICYTTDRQFNSFAFSATTGSSET